MGQLQGGEEFLRLVTEGRSGNNEFTLKKGKLRLNAREILPLRASPTVSGRSAGWAALANSL